MNYFKILRFIEKGNRNLFNYPKLEQMEFLSRLGEPKDDIDRGYKQYLCQNQYVKPNWKIVFFNIVGEIALPFVVLYFLQKRIWTKKRERKEAVFMPGEMVEVVPQSLHKQYRIYVMGKQLGTSLSLVDLRFVWRLWIKSLSQPYFAFKSMMNLAQYSDVIYHYRPLAIIQFGEYSFSSSILTAYCEQYKVKHINVMHGEKLYNIRDAFFRFHECYVWNEHYENLFISLKAAPQQFRIELPLSMKFDKKYYCSMNEYAEYKYYLGLFDENEIVLIANSMYAIKNKGHKIKFRPHPYYSNMKLLLKYVSEEDIESPSISILVSLSSCGNVVGLYSTALVQAFFNDINVIIDDVTFPERYKQLSDMNYILIGKVSKCLSNYLNKMNEIGGMATF